jgi:cell wall-associated NlpC family hydrolase
MYIAHKGSLSGFTLQAGDIIRYRKSGGQHTVLYIGGGQIAHASRKHAFPRITSAKPWNNSNVKKSTIQVLRAK